MQHSRSSPGPGIQKVIDHINAGIASGAYQPGAILPSRGELARMLSLSPDTVALAIGQLKRAGILAGVRGQRCWIPHQVSEQQRTLLGRSSKVQRTWDAVAERLKDDITTGAFPAGSALPTCKELSGRYRTSYVTLRKALDSLESLQLLTRRGRNFVVPAAALPAGRSHILFIWFNHLPYLPTHDTDSSFIRALERECLRNSVVLEKRIVWADPRGRVILWRHRDPAPVEKSIVESCMGVVYLVNWFASVNTVVFDWLAHLGKPVSIVDWLGDWNLPPAISGKPHIQLLRSSVTKRPGFDAGRFLISLGHRRIAYFSPYGLEWPAVRMQGIIDACKLAGATYGVEAFIQHQVGTEEEFQKLFGKRYSSIRSTMESPPDFPREYEAGRENLAGTAWLEYENATYFSTLFPLFADALARRQITAWVGCNDAVCMMAFSFLRSRQVAIPRKISLIGFGNTLASVKADMTSYDFNFEAAVGSILTFLLRPGLVSRIRKLARPLIEGFMIERGSTARV